jgi:hypothetical protein
MNLKKNLIVIVSLLFIIFIFINGCTSEVSKFYLNLSTTGYGTIEKDPDRIVFTSGESVLLTAVAVPETGWQFDHWDGDLTGVANPVQVTMNTNRSIKAVFSEIPSETFTLTLNETGQGYVEKNPNKEKYEYGESVRLTAVPEEDWRFDHWEGDLTGSTNPEQIVMNSDKVITAVFTERPQNTFVLNITVEGNGNISKNPDKNDYIFDEIVELTANPSLNWHFSHWIDDGTVIKGNNPLQISMIEDKNVTGIFQINTYTLEIQKDGEGAISKTPDKEEYEHGETIELNATPTTGWSFINWQKNGEYYSYNSRVIYQIDENVVFTALFEADGYILSLEKLGRGEVAKTPDKAVYLYGERVTISATPEIGWEFLHWLEDEEIYSENRTEEILMNESRSFVAVFLGNEYTITLEKEGQGEVSKVPDQETYQYGDEITLTAIPAQGWRFSRWLKNGAYFSSDAQKIVNVNDNATYKAIFEEIQYYTLDISVQGSGAVSRNPNEDPYEENTQVTLRANPSNGWRFHHWEGDLMGGTNPKQITMDSDKNITAVFVEIQYYTLDISIQGNGSVSRNPDENPYEENTIVTLTANPENDWRFDHWEGDITGSTNPKQITMNSNKSITAVFEEIQYYTLTTNVNGNGDITKNPDQSEYMEGTSVTLTANPDTGWQFVNWSGNLSGSSNPETIVMNSNKTVTANFEEIPPRVLLSDGTFGRNSIVNVYITAEYIDGVNGFDIVLNYDETYFSYLSSTLLNEFEGAIKLENQTSDGVIDISIARTGEVNIQSSQILEIKLQTLNKTGVTQITFSNDTNAVGAGGFLEFQKTDTGNYTIQ